MKLCLKSSVFLCCLLSAALAWAIDADSVGDDARGHWAFRRVVCPPLPEVCRREGLRTPIDVFIAAALETKGLSLNPEADRATLIRRVCFDLTGLPPTPAEIDAFVADRSSAAYEAMVERYLASPHYGERWGKYWLDAAGYADSNGYFSADSDRPLAYRYRDYVIDSFNRDKPHARFVREQLAGDELAGYVPGGDVTSEVIEPLIATHFLRNAPDGTGESDGNPDEVRTDRYTVLEGNLQITMSCLLGLTIQCARCHSHKFEPISHADYYRLQAIFLAAYNPERWTKPNERFVLVGSKAQREENQRRNERVDREIHALNGSLKAFAEPLGNKLRSERSGVVKITDDDLSKRFPEYATLRQHIHRTIAARERERPTPLPSLAVLVDTDSAPPAHHVLLRGQYNAPGHEVQPGVPAPLCLAGNNYQLEARPEGGSNTGRRSALARWVTSPENPLFARVMVNRIWQHHFGKGIVATPDNLGQSGSPPSHPELLDWLSSEFLRSGWSVKGMHRLILRSAVYRQTSTSRPDGERIDSGDRLLWRFPLRRLDAEALRDAMLAVAGELDRRKGGPYVPTQRRDDGTVAVDETRDGARRRSVYLQQRRTQTATVLELFDTPQLTPSCGFRYTSTVPLQSLALLNSDFVRARAKAFAGRLLESDANGDKRMTSMFRLAIGRGPCAEERAAAQRFLAVQRPLYSKRKDGEQRAWTDLCQMILATNAFLYVE